jgi:GT2 family glycosyltransferase
MASRMLLTSVLRTPPLLILNNDAVLVPGALTAMQKVALSSDDIGIVVPQQLLPAGERTTSVHAPESLLDYEADVSLSIHHNNVAHVPCFHDGNSVELTFAPFFCVYVKRNVWDALHGLDAEFGRHYRSDRVFCNMVREYLRMRIVYTPEARVYHMHQRATQYLKRENKDEYISMYQKNQWSSDLRASLGFECALWD